MNIYLTSGTPEFMEQLQDRHAKDNMIVMYGEGNAVLLHETDGDTVFATPRKFEVIDSVNDLRGDGYFVLNNIPVTDEGRPVFENRFLNRAGSVDSEPGFVAFRLLRPVDSDTYIVLTEWEGPKSFEVWRDSQAFKRAHGDKKPTPGTPKTNIFAAASYITTYTTAQPEEEA